MAIMPNAAATFSQDAAPLTEAKLRPPKTVKNIKTAVRPWNEPVSGRRRTAPMEKGVVIFGGPVDLDPISSIGCHFDLGVYNVRPC